MNLLRVLSLSTFLAVAAGHAAADPPGGHGGPKSPFRPATTIVLPQDGRQPYLDAFAAARREIRIEICVLEDPGILQGVKDALDRGVRVRVIVDNGKYHAITAERDNLKTYLTDAGGELHLSNPIFPRSFPKVILIDDRGVVVGSACLDSATFDHYRDYAHFTDARGMRSYLSRLFENDWRHSAPPGGPFPTYNPTTPLAEPDLIVSPVNAGARLVGLIQGARRSLDVTSELLGDPTLESELAAAVERGVRVRLIAPEQVNGATPETQVLQIASLEALMAAGVQVHVTRNPQTAVTPYMHARSAVVDGRLAYMGSISLSPDAATYDRNVGLILDERRFVATLREQFEIDFTTKSAPY